MSYGSHGWSLVTLEHCVWLFWSLFQSANLMHREIGRFVCWTLHDYVLLHQINRSFFLPLWSERPRKSSLSTSVIGSRVFWMSLIQDCATCKGNVLYTQPRMCLLALTLFYLNFFLQMQVFPRVCHKYSRLCETHIHTASHKYPEGCEPFWNEAVSM